MEKLKQSVTTWRFKTEKQKEEVDSFGWSGLIRLGRRRRRKRKRMNVLKDQGGQWQCGI